MTHSYRNKVRTAAGLLIFALWILILPLRWLMGAVIAAIFHELCHIGAVHICGGRISGFGADHRGALLESEEMTPPRQLICTLAGPVGGLMLLLLVKWAPVLAICALFHSAYNLLPIYPLDGGRAVRTALRILFPPQIAQRIANAIEWMCIAAVFGIACFAAFSLKWGIMPVILAVYLILRKNSLQSEAITSTIELI